jgi:flagellar protein FlgJ
MTKLSPTPQIPLPAQASPTPGLSAPGLSAKASSTSASTKLARPTQSVDLAKIAKSANDFEAMAIGQLLQPMFDTVDTSKSTFGGGAGEQAWKPMMVQEFAKQIAAHGGLGLAKPVYDAMLRMQQTNPK